MSGTKKIILKNEEARAKLIEGINEAADIVEASIGPCGRTVMIGRMYQPPEITGDGKKIMDAIILDDETMQLSVDFLRHSADRSDKTVGNGRKSTISILRALVNESDKQLKKLVDPVHPTKLIKEIKEAKVEVLKALEDGKKEIESKEDIAHIASVAMKSNEYGDLLADVFDKIGKNGVLNIEDGFATEVEYKDGLEIPCGAVSGFMEGEFNQIPVLVTTHSINSFLEIQPLMKKLIENKMYSLVIFASGFDNSVLGKLFELRLQGFTAVLIKLPAGKKEYFEDIHALVKGNRIIDADLTKLTDVAIEDLGECSKIILTKDSATMISTEGGSKEHLTELKERLDKVSSLYDKDLLEKRIAKLENGVAVLRVFAHTDIEREELKSKFKDAIASIKNSLRDGYVKGGGLALKEIEGDNILVKAIRAPYDAIQKNAGGELEISEDVIDSYSVVKQSLDNACELACEFINLGSSIADKREEPKNESTVL